MDFESYMAMDDRLRTLETIARRAYGKYRGVVVNNSGDPANTGRIQVRVPEIHGTDSVWAVPCVPYAGPSVGFFVLPPVDAAIWVEFEGGDPSRPIWVGCFWTDGQLPRDAVSPDARLLRTETAQLKFDDASGEVILENDNDAKLTLTTDAKLEAGGATHTVGASGVVSECAPGKVEVGPSGVSVNSGAFQVM